MIANIILNGSINKNFIDVKLKNQQNIYIADGAYNKIYDLNLNLQQAQSLFSIQINLSNIELVYWRSKLML